MKEVLFNNQEYGQILTQLDKLMQDAEQISDVDNKVLLYQVLQYFDSIHREPLSRIFQAVEDHPEIKDKMLKDPTVSKLLSLYDLVQEKADHKRDNQNVVHVSEEEVTIMTIPKKKDWLELGDYNKLEANKLYPKNYQKVNFLISRIGSEVFAIQNQCDGSFLPIDKGTVEDHHITCPWHGCKYDLRTGKAVDNSDKKLETYPVEIEESGLLKVEIAYQ